MSDHERNAQTPPAAKRGRGRPRIEGARVVRLELRVSAAEMASIERRAAEAGLTVAEWVRATTAEK